MKKKHTILTSLVDVIICVYGRFDLLERCLASIPDAFGEISYRIILIDNFSPNQEEADKFYASHSDVGKIIRNKKNIGYAPANNLGVRNSYSPLLFFLNSDVILDKDSAKHLIDNLGDEKIGVAGMFLTFPEDVNAMGLRPMGRPVGKVQHVGMETNIHGQFIHMYIGWSADNPRVLARRECYAVTGAALLTRRSLFERFKGFDEQYLQGTFEDADFCMNVRQAGYNIVVDLNAHAVHYTGASAESANVSFPVSDNQLKFIQKWKSQIKYSEYLAW